MSGKYPVVRLQLNGRVPMGRKERIRVGELHVQSEVARIVVEDGGDG